MVGPLGHFVNYSLFNLPLTIKRSTNASLCNRQSAVVEFVCMALSRRFLQARRGKVIGKFLVSFLSFGCNDWTAMTGSVRISKCYRLVRIFLALWLWCVLVSAPPRGKKGIRQESAK